VTVSGQAGQAGHTDETPPEPPFLRVVKGEPTDEELAALVTVLAAGQPAPSGHGQDAPVRRSPWSAPVRTMRGPHRRGPGQWRLSAHP